MDSIDPFAPLTEAELADAARQVPPDLEADAPKPTCPPLDAENGVLAAARLSGCKPDMFWRYETTEAETAFYAVRWNERDGKKVIRPLSWFDDAGWKFAAWPNNRPLYNLPAIAEQPNAPIIICEGEKAADAVALIFPKSIATTSSGGAGAAAKTDWTPLAGRLVLIWPDADAAGEKYAREVATKLKMLDCSVSIIDAKELASIDPGGGAREPEKGWDAADAIGEWKDAGALRKAAVGLAKSFDAGPVLVCHGQFEMRADSLWCKIPIKSKKDDQDEAGENLALQFVRNSWPRPRCARCSMGTHAALQGC
jgi:putative DNA primase/helicase